LIDDRLTALRLAEARQVLLVVRRRFSFASADVEVVLVDAIRFIVVGRNNAETAMDVNTVSNRSMAGKILKMKRTLKNAKCEMRVFTLKKSSSTSHQANGHADQTLSKKSNFSEPPPPSTGYVAPLHE
jgi:hypothetical protein